MNNSRSHIIEVLQDHNGFLAMPPNVNEEIIKNHFNMSIDEFERALKQLTQEEVVYNDKHGLRLIHWPFGKLYRQIRKKRR